VNTADAFLILNLLPEIGPVRANKLLRRFGDPAAVLEASTRSLAEVPGISPRLAAVLSGWREHCDPDKEKEMASRAGVSVIIRDDDKYPELLREISDPPLVLYVRGCLDALSNFDRALAIVGTRGPTNYGVEVTRHLGGAAVFDGWTVVSGLARGIDTAAHQAVVKAGGCTAAVLGSGLANLYPRENQGLARDICERGLLISELPMQMKPTRLTFPMRNRLIAGLTLGTVVVEAGSRSGALITAAQALEQNRRVFAVPGRVDSPASRGCHSLIKDGATLVERFSDITVEFAFGQPFPGIRDRESPPSEEQNSAGNIPKTGDAGIVPPVLTEDEKSILEMIGGDEMHIDDLIVKSGEPAHRVLAVLSGLEMRRLIVQMPGKKVSSRFGGFGD